MSSRGGWISGTKAAVIVGGGAWGAVELDVGEVHILHILHLALILDLGKSLNLIFHPRLRAVTWASVSASKKGQVGFLILWVKGSCQYPNSKKWIPGVVFRHSHSSDSLLSGAILFHLPKGGSFPPLTPAPQCLLAPTMGDELHQQCKPTISFALAWIFL